MPPNRILKCNKNNCQLVIQSMSYLVWNCSRLLKTSTFISGWWWHDLSGRFSLGTSTRGWKINWAKNSSPKYCCWLENGHKSCSRRFGSTSQRSWGWWSEVQRRFTQHCQVNTLKIWSLMSKIAIFYDLSWKFNFQWNSGRICLIRHHQVNIWVTLYFVVMVIIECNVPIFVQYVSIFLRLRIMTLPTKTRIYTYRKDLFAETQKVLPEQGVASVHHLVMHASFRLEWVKWNQFSINYNNLRIT